MFPINPVKGESYIVANKEWLFNGYGFILVPDSSISEESDPIWNSEKHEYAKKTELEDYVPLDTLDSALIDYVKQEEISDVIPQFQKTITQDQFVWYNDYLVIDIGEISHSKKVTILNLYIYTSKGIIKGTSIVSYPTSKANTTSLPFTYFYLKDTLGIISKANDIEKISISYNISNQDKEVDIQGTLGRNILFEEAAGNQAHGKFVMDSFHGVYPENTHQKILSIDLPEVTGDVPQAFQPYICSKYECNLVSKPYVGAATNENYLSNPEILTIGAHYNNDNIRRDITSAPDKFLSNTVAVSAGQNKDDTDSLWTSYGYGVEFFESWAKEEIDQRYPNKDIYDVVAKIITTPDNQGLIYKSDGTGWLTLVEVGQKIWIKYSSSNEVEIIVTDIISNDEIRINQTVDPILETDPPKYLYTYVTVGSRGYYRPQQSPTCGMVAAKFREIQDKTNANWQVCREAARATASNSTFTLEGTDKIWTTNWDMHRGFGIIDVDLAVEYIHQHYIDNVDYKKSAAYTLPKSNPFLGVDDIERDTFVSKANLEEYIERFSGNASLPQNISDALDNSVNPSAVNPFTTKTELDSKLNSEDFTKANISLGNVDNTSDLDKPISTLTQAALNGKENSFTKNNAFNKTFGTGSENVPRGNDSRINNGQTAYGWGDHSQEGYLTNETDPIFTSHPASGVVSSGDGTKYLSDDGTYKEVSGGLASIAEETNEAIREIEKYENGNDVFNYTTGSLYEFNDSISDSDDNDNFLKPNDLVGIGRWVKRQDFAKKSDLGLTPEQLEILEAFRASFSFSGLEIFKQSFSLDLIITSVVIAPNITELRVGKNAATPTDIMGQLPLTLSESDTLTFEATYNRELDSYFTLIGKKLWE